MPKLSRTDGLIFTKNTILILNHKLNSTESLEKIFFFFCLLPLKKVSNISQVLKKHTSTCICARVWVQVSKVLCMCCYCDESHGTLQLFLCENFALFVSFCQRGTHSKLFCPQFASHNNASDTQSLYSTLSLLLFLYPSLSSPFSLILVVTLDSYMSIELIRSHVASNAVSVSAWHLFPFGEITKRLNAKHKSLNNSPYDCDCFVTN